MQISTQTHKNQLLDTQIYHHRPTMTIKSKRLRFITAMTTIRWRVGWGERERERESVCVCVFKKKKTKKNIFLAHSWCDGHSKNINACGV